MGGWAGSRRRETLPPDWDMRAAATLRRAGHRCEHVREDTGRPCGERATDADHIIPHSEGGDDGPGNLQALCQYHHNRKSGFEGARGAARARARKQPPKHPGIR